MIALITLNIPVGGDAGPFNLFSNVDGYTTAFETGISAAALTAGYTSTVVPEGTTIIRVVSTGWCTNYIDITINLIPTTTTTSSSSTSTTTSTSTTAVPTTTTTTSSSSTTTTTTTVEPTTTTTTTVEPTTTTTTTAEPTTTTTTTSSGITCTQYTAESSGGGPGSVFYTDCADQLQELIIENETIVFCAQEGSVSVTPGIGLTNNGPCETECIEFYADGTDAAGDVSFIDCDGNPITVPVALDEITANYCGKLGTITSTAPLVSIVGPCSI